MKVTIEKKTDQLNYEDFLSGVTRVVTITGVRKGTKEQQYDIAIEGDSRVWRPSVTVLKQLVAAWGDDATEWVGHQAKLYGDPTITFGPDKVGGIRISHLSHIDGPVTESLSVTRGKRKPYTVQPLPAAKPPLTDAMIATVTDRDQITRWWNEYPGQRAAIKARIDELKADQPAIPVGEQVGE